MFIGKGVSKGIGIGYAKILKNDEIKLTNFKVDDKENELKYFRKCLNDVVKDTQNVVEKLSGTEADIMNAYLMILQDPTLTTETERLIQEEGYNAGYATKIGFETVEEVFKNNMNKMQIYNENIVNKIRRIIFNKFMGKNKYIKFLKSYETEYLEDIKNKNDLKILDLAYVLKAIEKQMKIANKQIANEYTKMIYN